MPLDYVFPLWESLTTGQGGTLIAAKGHAILYYQDGRQEYLPGVSATRTRWGWHISVAPVIVTFPDGTMGRVPRYLPPEVYHALCRVVRERLGGCR